MKKVASLVFLCTVTLILSSFHGSLNAMKRLDLNAHALKRSRLENNTQAVPSEAEFRAALDAALLKVDDDGNTVLHGAVADGNLVMCRELLASGASPLTQNKQGLSPLHCAVLGNYHELAQQLLDGMPNKAKRERIFTVLCILRRLSVPAVLRLTLLSYLPDLITAYPRLCKTLVPHYITFLQLCSAHCAPQVQLLTLQDKEGHTAHSIAKNNRNNFMARMTNPKSRISLCEEQITQLLHNPYTAPKENKE